MKHAFLLLAALTATLCLSRTSAQIPPSPPLTGKIAHITILGVKNIPIDTVRAVLTLHPGDAYTPEAAAKETAVIKSMGVFNAATEAATADPVGGVNVTYTVLENPVIQTIKFTTNAADGKPSVPFSELLAQMKTQPGQVLNTNFLVKDLDNMFNHTNGYAFKQGRLLDVSNAINIDPKNGVLTIPLNEYYIQSIQITGNRRIKTENILAQMHTKVGDIYDSRTIVNDQSLIYEMGGFRQVGQFFGTSNEPGKISIAAAVVEQPAATGVLDEKQGKVIPFVYDPVTSPFPVVQVSVNGKPPLPFIVDTGTTAALSINPWAAQQLGLRTTGPAEKGNGFTFLKVPVQNIVLLGTDNAHDVRFETPTAQIIDTEFMNQVFPDRRIAGLVGLELLAPLTSRFDFAAKTLTLFTAPHAPLNTPGGIVLPLHLTPSKSAFAVRINLAPGTDTDLILDTGSMGTEIPLSALALIHPAAVAFAGGSIWINSVYIGPDLRLTNLRIGTLDVPDVVVGTQPSFGHMSLGLNILAGYRMTLDGPNGQLTLEPSAKGKRYVIGRSGLDIKPVSAGWLISKFIDKSPAQAAGLRVNDEVIAASGIDLKGLTEMQAGRLLSGISGAPVHVRVRRADKEITLSWVPTDEFSEPPDALDGLATSKTPGDTWIILGVTKGCLSDKAGLLVGDRIIQVGGEEAASMTLDRYIDLIKKPVVLLEVTRAGMAKPFTVRLSAPK